MAVQLLEREEALNFDSLRRLAEQLEGSYTFTLLGPKQELYFIKGATPCVSTITQVWDFTCRCLLEDILNWVLRCLVSAVWKPMPVSIQERRDFKKSTRLETYLLGGASMTVTSFPPRQWPG